MFVSARSWFLLSVLLTPGAPAATASGRTSRVCPGFLYGGGCSFRAVVVFAERATDAWCTRGDGIRDDIGRHRECARDFSTAADVRSARSWFSLSVLLTPGAPAATASGTTSVLLTPGAPAATASGTTS
ncbi:hypothetical protein ISCGN_019420 [Ixodes scapularis]